MAASAVAALVWALWRRPDLRAAARAGDALGFSERFVTALELGDHPADPVAALAVADAEETARKTDLAALYRFRFEQRRWGVTAGLLVAVFLAAAVPSSVQAAREPIAAVEETARETLEALEKREDLPEAEKAALTAE